VDLTRLGAKASKQLPENWLWAAGGGTQEETTAEKGGLS
jgi:hypothetical protein